MYSMFTNCSSLTSLDLSSFDTSNVTNIGMMFYNCLSLTSLDLSNFDTSNVTTMSSMFISCSKLKYIRCKQAFKDWCIENQGTISLPNAMREGGSGIWDIIDAVPDIPPFVPEKSGILFTGEPNTEYSSLKLNTFTTDETGRYFYELD